MLTKDEKLFIAYWKENRLSRKRSFRQLAVGLPLAMAMIIAIFVNFFSGWYKRADMIKNTDPSLVLILLIAAMGIAVFVTIFSVRHKWDINEQRYRELLAREDEPEQ